MSSWFQWKSLNWNTLFFVRLTFYSGLFPFVRRASGGGEQCTDRSQDDNCLRSHSDSRKYSNQLWKNTALSYPPTQKLSIQLVGRLRKSDRLWTRYIDNLSIAISKVAWSKVNEYRTCTAVSPVDSLFSCHDIAPLHLSLHWKLKLTNSVKPHTRSTDTQLELLDVRLKSQVAYLALDTI